MLNSVQIENLSFWFSSDKKILNNISMSIPKGEFYSILGASGSGKSTLLRIISNILPSSNKECLEGVLAIFGKTPEEYLDTGKLSFMFQEATLMPNLNVRENIAFPFKLRGIEADENFVDELLETVGLYEHQQKYPSQLSGGMKTRVSLARAFVTKPELLLLDEPFSALDISWRYELYNYLQKIRQKFNTTVLLVTHDIQEAVVLADKALVFSKKGTIIDAIQPKQVKGNSYTFNGINSRIEANIENIFSLQTKIMVDNIRENYSLKEVIEIVDTFIAKTKDNLPISEYEIKELQCVQKHINNKELYAKLLQLWDDSKNWELKNELLWRLLDNKDVSIDIHKKVHFFIQLNWDKYVKYVQQEQYFRKDRIIEDTIKRLEDSEYPSSKDWLYLKYLDAMTEDGDNEIRKTAEVFIKQYQQKHLTEDFIKLSGMFKLKRIDIKKLMNEK